MFDFEPGLAFWTIISFGIFLFIIQKYVLPPLRQILQERQQQIEKSLSESELARAAAQELLEKGKAEMQKTYREAEAYAAQVKKNQEEQQQKQLEQFQKNMEDLKKKQAQELKKMEETVLSQVQDKVGSFIASACEKIIEKELPAELKTRIIEKNIESLEKL